jgi:aryl-alcohol dehydrogenase-like predicted oxidoreductase
VETRMFGSTGQQLPVIGLGTWATFDVPASEEPRVREVVDSALSKGIRVFDSSPMYGRAEGALARALAPHRPQAWVATKVWNRSADAGKQHFAAQLAMFGGVIDLEQIHNLVAWRAHLHWLETERDSGRIRLIGATHYDSAAFTDLERVMKTRRIDAIQIPLNPLERDAERRILPLAEELGLGVVVMRPFAEGALLPGPDKSAFRGLGVSSWASALIKWILADRRVHVVIPATRRISHVAANVAAAAGTLLDPDQRRHVEQLVRSLPGCILVTRAGASDRLCRDSLGGDPAVEVDREAGNVLYRPR